MDTRTKRFAEFLTKAHLREQNRRGKTMNQNDFVKWLGVKNTSYSSWINEIRLPTGNNVHLLAAKLGPEVYDILGLPRQMPADPEAEEILNLYLSLTDTDRVKLLEYARKIVDNCDEETVEAIT